MALAMALATWQAPWHLQSHGPHSHGAPTPHEIYTIDTDSDKKAPTAHPAAAARTSQTSTRVSIFAGMLRGVKYSTMRVVVVLALLTAAAAAAIDFKIAGDVSVVDTDVKLFGSNDDDIYSEWQPVVAPSAECHVPTLTPLVCGARRHLRHVLWLPRL